MKIESSDRRTFLKTSTVTGAAALAGALPVKAAGPVTGKLKIGIVGCGGRGSGAVMQALKADADAVLYAMGDIYEAPIKGLLNSVKGSRPGQAEVEESRMFTGLDCYKKVIDLVDVVLLATPPGFRPQGFAYAVEKGIHIFSEKPCAVDGPGVRIVMEAAKKARQKNLTIVCGFCWRYNNVRREAMQLVHDGAIGEIASIYTNYLTGPVKPMPPASSRPDGISDVDWQVRNWYNFAWLSGDGLVEQAVHSIDKMCWVMKDVPPVSCVANGGRAVAANGGNIFDHFSVYYKYANGVFGHHGSRQISGAWGQNADFINGSKGRLIIGAGAVRIEGENAWRAKGTENDMYQQEHNELFASIRKGEAKNDGDWLASSTLTAIMGRMAAYTGQEVTWEQALNSQHNLLPDGVTMDNLTWDQKLDHIPLAVPGRTKLG